MGRKRSAACFVMITAAGIAGGACGLFETRQPTQPQPPAQGCRPLTTGPTAAVIPNIEDFYGLTAGITCYNSMLDTSFVFHPDPTDSSQALPQTPYVNWDEAVEANVNSRIASQQDFMEVDFQSEYSPAIISTDQETRFYRYQLRLSFTSAPDTVRYTGLADLTFRRSADGQWKITDWVDHRGTVSDSTWGLLRGDQRP